MCESQKCWNDDDELLLERTRQQHKELIANIRTQIKNSSLTDSERVLKQSLLQECESQLKTFDSAIRLLADSCEQKNELQKNERCRVLQREIKRLQSRLPIYARRDEIVNAVRANQVLIVKAQTGAGKSTQVVQYLVDAGLVGHGEIVCIQPRRFAARALADRVAEEFGCRVGEEVDTALHSETPSKSKSARIRFVTASVLLDEYRRDKRLSSYSIVIIDEAHERFIDTDLLFGVMKICLQQRSDIKLIVMSATLDIGLIRTYYGRSHVLEVAGRTYPIEDYFSVVDSDDNYVNQAILKACEIHESNQPGDILAFLTGPDEIDEATMEVERRLKDSAIVLPLHAKLHPDETKRIFERTPVNKRKIIFSTNVAETSVTIDGVQHVIESGMVKEMMWDEKLKMQALKIGRITQSSAIQRRGRAGRTSPGKCHYLYTRTTFKAMSVCPRAEILQMEPSIAVLKLMHFAAIDDVEKFHWLEAPSKESIRLAIRRLHWLKAIDLTSNRLTEIGQRMAQLGLLPMLSAMVLSATDKACINHVLVLAGMLNVSDSVWWRSRDMGARERAQKIRIDFFRDNQKDGDFILLLRIFLKWQTIKPNERKTWCENNSISMKALKIALEFANDIARQLRVDLPKFDQATLDRNLINEIMGCVKTGFFQNLAIFSNSTRVGYRLSSNVQGQPGINAKIYNLSSLFSNSSPPTYVLYHTILNLKHISCMVTLCPIEKSEIPKEWIDYYSGKPIVLCPKPQNIVPKTSIPIKVPSSKRSDQPLAHREEQNQPREPSSITSKSNATSEVDSERSLHSTEMFNTIEVVSKGSYSVGNKEIKFDTKQMKTIIYNHASKLYDSVTKSLSDFNTFPFPSTSVHVVNKDRLVVYKELVSQGRHPVLLNMACPQSPGGNYQLGVRTQEATLFLRSNYFLSLDASLDYIKPTNRFCYDSNCELQPLFKYQRLYPIDEFGAIYTSGMTIFRESEKEGYAFMEKPLLNMCTIAMAAYRNTQPNNEAGFSAKYSIGLRKKIANLFSIAYHQGHDSLVLSAFGCGNFRNPPNHVAAVFHSVIEQYAGFFKQIKFAIFDDYNNGQCVNPGRNYESFKKLLDNVKVEPLQQRTPDTMIGPWRIMKTTEREIHLSSVNIYSQPLCLNGGECKNLHNVEHCDIYSHPPMCPFSIDSKSCTQKANHDHMLWFKHDLQNTHGMSNNSNDDSRLSRPIDRNFSSNQQRFNSSDRLHLASTASLWSEDCSSARTNPELSMNSKIHDSYHSTSFSKEKDSNSTQRTQAYPKSVYDNPCWSTHLTTDAEPYCSRRSSSYRMKPDESGQAEIVRHETNTFLLPSTRTDYSIPRLFNRESQNISAPQFSAPFERFGIGDRLPHRDYLEDS
ncbi:hypothetical protein I4U23_022398 [Adineta vaga]|nr:hypothetical protein I4U23_022398 [Adineta vaga]